MKLDSDRRAGTDYFSHKFMGKVEAIFNGLPKPKDRRSFYEHDLPLITDIDPKLAVHRSNNQNRDATPGQKAMAFAMQFPEGTNKGGRGKTSILDIEVSKPYITKARYVLRNSPMVEGDRYPRRCLDNAAKLHLAASLRMGDWLRNCHEKTHGARGIGSNQHQVVESQNETPPETYTSLGIDKRGSLCNR